MTDKILWPGEALGDRARTFDQVVETLVTNAMEPYGSADDAFRRNPAMFSQLAGIEPNALDPLSSDSARTQFSQLLEAFDTREGHRPETAERHILRQEAGVLASPSFYRALVAPLSPEERAAVRHNTRELVERLRGTEHHKVPDDTRAIFAIYVALDAAGHSEARDFYGRMMTEAQPKVLDTLGEAYGVTKDMRREVVVQRKGIAMERDASLGRQHKRERASHERGYDGYIY